MRAFFTEKRLQPARMVVSLFVGPALLGVLLFGWSVGGAIVAGLALAAGGALASWGARELRRMQDE